MSNPSEVVTQDQTFEDQVTEAISKASIQDGKTVLAGDLSESVKYAATAELRRRDTQSAYTKAQKSLKKTEAELGTFQEAYKVNARVEIPESDKIRLEELKFSDPDAWRRELNVFEKKAMTEAETSFNERRSEAGKKAELEHRASLIAEHNASNPKMQITDDVIQNDIPAKYIKDLDLGNISFDGFIEKVKGFLTKGTALKEDEPVMDQPNMSSVGGGSKVIDSKDVAKASYETDIY